MNIDQVCSSAFKISVGDRETEMVKKTNLISSWSSTILLFCLFFIFNTILITSFADNVQDTCPTGQNEAEAIFINGFPCKNPAAIVPSDFKTSEMNREGDTDNFLRSSMSIITAAKFPGLNTLGLSIARTDIDVDGMVQPHSHPRASEMLYVSNGVVTVGFVDTEKRVFQKTLRKGDVYVFPRGLLHYSLNAGFEPATILSVLNSQNPGVVSITDAMFGLRENSRYVFERLMMCGLFLDNNTSNIALFSHE